MGIDRRPIPERDDAGIFEKATVTGSTRDGDESIAAVRDISVKAASAPVGAQREHVFLVSIIPVMRTANGWATLDLWARDINAQSKLVDITLYCPIRDDIKSELAPIDSNIEVIDSMDPRSYGALGVNISNATFVQLPGNFGWKESAPARRVIKLARRLGRPAILGISSNRARTNLINQRNASWPRRMAARLRYLDIRFTQRWLAKRADGVFLVGAGLIPLVQGANANVHVGIASWIADEDIRTSKRAAGATLRICMAGRLERMKGFHIGLAAIAELADDLPVSVSIIGAGPEEDRLRHLAHALGLNKVEMHSPVPYPGPFLEFLDNQDIVLLTNLNDEQPRLIFDAVSRGCIPICPATAPYISLGLNPLLLYRQGDAGELAVRIRALADPRLRADLQDEQVALARRFTMQSMHQERLAWVRRTMTAT